VKGPLTNASPKKYNFTNVRGPLTNVSRKKYNSTSVRGPLTNKSQKIQFHKRERAIDEREPKKYNSTNMRGPLTNKSPTKCDLTNVPLTLGSVLANVFLKRSMVSLFTLKFSLNS